MKCWAESRGDWEEKDNNHGAVDNDNCDSDDDGGGSVGIFWQKSTETWRERTSWAEAAKQVSAALCCSSARSQSSNVLILDVGNEGGDGGDGDDDHDDGDWWGWQYVTHLWPELYFGHVVDVGALFHDLRVKDIARQRAFPASQPRKWHWNSEYASSCQKPL